MNDILEHDVFFFPKTPYSSICWRNKIEIYHPYQENVGWLVVLGLTAL